MDKFGVVRDDLTPTPESPIFEDSLKAAHTKAASCCKKHDPCKCKTAKTTEDKDVDNNK